MIKLKVLLCLTCIVFVASVPVPVKKEEELTEAEKKEQMKDEPEVLQDWELNLEYGRYLKEVVQALESDQSFRKKLETAEADDIKSGKIARELHFVDHNVRTKLDELKRRELERLRHLVTREQEKAEGIDRSKFKVPVHLDHLNPERFEVEDLKKLIKQTTQDLEAVDKQRRKDFEQYEMQKEFEYKQNLEKLSPEERKKLEEKHNAEMKKHKDHPKLHHPGSKPQLEEVWEEQDHMNRNDFDPKTFFHIHDLDGNGAWDEAEVKALFLKELDKMYDPNASEDDLIERQEEMERMREHIFSEADVNKDDLISFDEFLTQTKKSDFDVDEGWEGLDEQELYSPQDFQEYQLRRQKELEDAGIHVPYNAVPIPHPDDLSQYPNMVNPQYQAHPGQVPQGYIASNQLPPGYVAANQVPQGYVQLPQGQVHQGIPNPVAAIPPGYEMNNINLQPIAGHQAALPPQPNVHYQQQQFQQQQQQQQPQFQQQRQQFPQAQVPLHQQQLGQVPVQQQQQGQVPLHQQQQGQVPVQQQQQGQVPVQQQQQGQVPVQQQGQVPVQQQGQVPVQQQGQVPVQQQGQVPVQQQGQIPVQQQGQVPVQQQQQGQVPVQQQQQGQVPVQQQGQVPVQQQQQQQQQGQVPVQQQGQVPVQQQTGH